MTTNISTEARNAAGNTITSLLNNGSIRENPYMEIRTGSKPDSPQATASGAVLATIEFLSPAFEEFRSGSAPANLVSSVANVVETGVASWFRCYNRDEIAVFDGDITAINGGGDIEFNNTNFIAGGTITADQLSATVLQSC